MNSRSALRAILLGGLVAGTIDIGAASAISERSPILILRVIAGGILGRASLQGGAATAILGLFLQWAMALIIAAIFVGAARYLETLRRHWLLAGIAYGVPVYLVMNFVVVPLSAWHRMPAITPYNVIANLLAMLLFGAIVSWFASGIRDSR
ncbi:MAG TPA: hypothetical protein VKR31_01625 [Rhizomicrobium sp.]|nr:hypothetical protein [Rhizomicrobium sp.]